MYRLFSFAFFPRFDDSIHFLATSLAAHEPWDFSDSKVTKHAILKNFLEFTYRKLVQEHKIAYSADNEFACFNTGLVTPNLEDIFAFFEKYRNPRDINTPPFFFRAFLKESDNCILRNFADTIPSTADFFQNPELLIFNPRCKLIPDVDHIIQDNKARFPSHLQQADDRDLRRHLIGAIDEVKRKVRTNYKTAVPQYYNGRIQLLLPLCLTTGSPNPDLALVTHKLNHDTYTARTCLTLKMAYNNARLIVKPESNWLKP